MKILVIDGQGGGVGKNLIAALKREMPSQPLIALGTNTQATAAMLKAGADQGATGENAIRYQCKSADVIVGVTGLLNANSMLGEVSPAIAMAISLSEAQKVLVPLEYLALMMPMTSRLPVFSFRRTVASLMGVSPALLSTGQVYGKGKSSNLPSGSSTTRFKYISSCSCATFV